jgi:hypothetical protein
MLVFSGPFSFVLFEHATETGNDLFEHTGWEPGADPDDQANAGSHGYRLHLCYRVAREETIKKVARKSVSMMGKKERGGTPCMIK